MGVEMTEDATVDAHAVFALSPTLAAVVLGSDIPAVAKHRRRLKGVAAKRSRSAYDEVLKEAMAGNLGAAKALAAKGAGNSPPTVWWVESEAELAAHLKRIYQAAGQRRMVLAWDADLLGGQVARVSVWWDY